MRIALIALTIAAALALSSVARADFDGPSQPMGPCGIKIIGHEADWDACEKALKKFTDSMMGRARPPAAPPHLAPPPPPVPRAKGFDI